MTLSLRVEMIWFADLISARTFSVASRLSCHFLFPNPPIPVGRVAMPAPVMF